MNGARHRPVIHKPPLLCDDQQARLPQNLDMARKFVLGFEETIHQFAKAGFLASRCQNAKNTHSGRISERLKDKLRQDIYGMHNCIIAQLCNNMEIVPVGLR